MLKTCTKCKIEKPIDNFNKKKRSKDGFQNICRECSAEHSRQYYKENRDSHIMMIKNNKDKYKKASQQFVYDYLLEHPCVMCGESNPVILEFDHLENKEIAISACLNNVWSIKRIKTEIAKCQVLCANCHRMKTAKDFNWFSYKLWVMKDLNLQPTG